MTNKIINILTLQEKKKESEVKSEVKSAIYKCESKKKKKILGERVKWDTKGYNARPEDRYILKCFHISSVFSLVPMFSNPSSKMF